MNGEKNEKIVFNQKGKKRRRREDRKIYKKYVKITVTIKKIIF